MGIFDLPYLKTIQEDYANMTDQQKAQVSGLYGYDFSGTGGGWGRGGIMFKN